MGVTWRIPTEAFGVQGLVEIGMLFTEGEWAIFYFHLLSSRVIYYQCEGPVNRKHLELGEKILYWK